MPWAHASTVLIPKDDLLERLERSRKPDAEDMLAVAFHGLARRSGRGSVTPRDASKP